MAWRAARRVGAVLGFAEQRPLLHHRSSRSAATIATGGRRSFHGTREECYSWLKEYKSQLLVAGAVIVGAFYVPLPLLMGSHEDDDDDDGPLLAQEVAKFVSLDYKILTELQANDNVLSKLQIEVHDVRRNNEEEMKKVKKELESLKMAYAQMVKDQSMVMALLNEELQFGKKQQNSRTESEACCSGMK